MNEQSPLDTRPPPRISAPLAVVFAAFLSLFFLFHVRPTFLTFGQMSFHRPVPVAAQVGSDFTTLRGFAARWAESGVMPYKTVDDSSLFRAPLAVAMARPFTALRPTHAYTLFCALTVLCFCGALFLSATRLAASGERVSLGLLLCGVGLLGYPMQFQLERGQFDAIALLPTLAGLVLTTRPGLARPLAGLALLSIAAHLKLYPGIFLLVVACQCRPRGQAIAGVLFLAAFNLVLLFGFGWRNGVEFLRSLRAFDYPLFWAGNHSISSFVRGLPLQLAQDRPGLFTMTLFALFLAVLAVAAWRAFRARSTGINAPLALIAAAGAMFLPSESHDYKLVFLAPFLLLFLDHLVLRWSECDRTRLQLLLVAAASLLYFATTWSYVAKRIALPVHGGLLHNNFPLLFGLALTALAASFLQPSSPASDLRSPTSDL